LVNHHKSKDRFMERPPMKIVQPRAKLWAQPGLVCGRG
jgi:hypothetical protein